MPRTATKSLTFPLAGVSRRGSYRQQTRPFSAPWAVNVRTVGPSETRRRGGSRPGLAKFCNTDLGSSITTLLSVPYIDSSGARQYDLVYVADSVLGYIRGGTVYNPTAELQDDTGQAITADDDVSMDFSSGVTGQANAVVRNGKVYLAYASLKTYEPSLSLIHI